MAKITFTDDVGTATLQSAQPAPANRFRNWVPITRPIGTSLPRQSDGHLYTFTTRIQYGASFELHGISGIGVGSMVEIADRLRYWLMAGGECHVYTEDYAGDQYDCTLMPDSQIQIRLEDSALLEYMMSLSLINIADPSFRMVARYAA